MVFELQLSGKEGGEIIALIPFLNCLRPGAYNRRHGIIYSFIIIFIVGLKYTAIRLQEMM